MSAEALIAAGLACLPREKRRAWLREIEALSFLVDDTGDFREVVTDQLPRRSNSGGAVYAGAGQ